MTALGSQEKASPGVGCTSIRVLQRGRQSRGRIPAPALGSTFRDERAAREGPAKPRRALGTISPAVGEREGQRFLGPEEVQDRRWGGSAPAKLERRRHPPVRASVAELRGRRRFALPRPAISSRIAWHAERTCASKLQGDEGEDPPPAPKGDPRSRALGGTVSFGRRPGPGVRQDREEHFRAPEAAGPPPRRGPPAVSGGRFLGPWNREPRKTRGEPLLRGAGKSPRKKEGRGVQNNRDERP